MTGQSIDMSNHNANDDNRLHIGADNRFAIIPHWVIFSGITSGALHLYAVLTKYADGASKQAWPSRATLARDIGKSVDTVDRHMKELEGIGAVVVTRRKRQGSEQNLVNLYTVVTAYPRKVAATVRPPSRVDAAESIPSTTTPSFNPDAVTSVSDDKTPTPVVETTTDHSLQRQIGVSKEQKDQLVDTAVNIYYRGIDEWDDDQWADYAEQIEDVTGVFVTDFIADKRFSERLGEVIEANLDKGPRYGASAWLGTLVNTARWAA